MLLTEILVTAYTFVVGACVGSFLNVVAWRLPLGMSLLRPASHCPKCKTPIRLRDNIPILGWILLGGRCRSCGCHISPRYPLVEFFVAVAFGVLGWFELATGGIHLPPRHDVWKPIEIGLPFDWVYLGLWIYHATLVSLLVTIVLVELDRQRLTRGFYIFLLLAGCLPPLIWPELRTSFLQERIATAWSRTAGLQQGLRYLVFSATLGLCLGWSFDPRREARQRAFQLSTALAAVGVFLGGEVVFPVASFVAVFLVVLRLLAFVAPALDAVPRTAIVLMTALCLIPRWPIFTLEYRLDSGVMFRTVVITGGASIALAIIYWLKSPPAKQPAT